MGGFKFKPLFNFSKWISAPVFPRTYLLYTETTSKSSSKVACCRERHKKTPTHPSHSRQQGHLAWDSFYDPSEISLLFYKVVILLHMHVCYLTLVSQ